MTRHFSLFLSLSQIWTALGGEPRTTKPPHPHVDRIKGLPESMTPQQMTDIGLTPEEQYRHKERFRDRVGF